MAGIKQVDGLHRKKEPDPKEDALSYLQYWRKKAKNRRDFLTRLKVVFTNFEEKKLLSILSVTVEGSIAYTAEQKQFIDQFGKPLLNDILAKFRNFPTTPSKWVKAPLWIHKDRLFFRKDSLRSILGEFGSQNADLKALQALDQVLVDFGKKLVYEALRLRQYSNPSRKTLRSQDINLALRFLTNKGYP